MKLLEMSISAGVLVFFVMLLRAMGLSSLPKRIFVLLWMVVLIRLLIPVSLPIKSGIATPAFRFLREAARWLKQGLYAGTAGNVSVPVPEAASSGAVQSAAKNGWLAQFSELLPVFYGIWIAGTAAFGIYFIYSFIKEYRMLAQALPLETLAKMQVQNAQEQPAQDMQAADADACCLQELYRSARRIVGIRHKGGEKERLLAHDRLASPLVWGIAKQRIVLPKQMAALAQPQIEYILAHEMVHIRRRDNFWKFLSAAAVCIHWFNPMAWMMYILFARDLELSCDERVIALYGSRSREDYAMTLLTFVQNQRKPALFCSGFGKNPTKERIVAIMKYKRLTSAGILSAVTLMMCAATVFAGNEKAMASKAQDAAAEAVQLTAVQVEGQDIEKADADDAKLTESGGSSETPDEDVVYGKDDETIQFKVESKAETDGAELEYYIIAGESDSDVKKVDLKDGESTMDINGKKYRLRISSNGNADDVEMKAVKE